MTVSLHRVAILVGVIMLLAGGGAMAQTLGVAAPTPTAVENQAPAGPEALVLQDQRGTRPPPLGADIFGGAPPSVSNTIVDSGYVMKPGDQVRVTFWGLVNSDDELTIDSQGNVVVPGVGPVRIAGLTAGETPRAIERASRRVYSDGVQVYAAPVASAAVQVLVTGPVARPGAFAGASDDALVVYLQRAGGIDPNRGSYRRVRVVRNGETIAQGDLYDFLISGSSPRILFRNGDAIVVENQGPVVSVSGDVRAPFTFELDETISAGSEITRFARPRPGATHAAIVGVRDGIPFSSYVPLVEFETFALQDGDRVQFESDSRGLDVLVRVEGAHEGPSVFSIARGSTVNDVLRRVSIDSNANMETIHLRRQSVREAQRALIRESLDRLERTVLTSPGRTPSEVSARASSLAFVTQFIERARQVEPNGVLALADQDLDRVRLENGDVIVIPDRSQVVTIAGEVNAPQSTLEAAGSRVPAYVDLAGGYTRRADRGRTLIFRQDGRIRTDGLVAGGDRILVPAKPDSTLLPFIRDITQTLFQIGGVFLAFDRN